MTGCVSMARLVFGTYLASSAQQNKISSHQLQLDYNTANWQLQVNQVATDSHEDR